MSEKETGGTAFPSHGNFGEVCYEGMTLRQYAAIKLRVPDSGTDWLDEMILQSQRDEFAAKAMQGLLADVPRYFHGMNWKKSVVEAACEFADTMLKARKC